MSNFSSQTGKMMEIVVLGEEDIIGELSLIDGLPCGATVTALEDCTLIRLITPERFNTLCHDHPETLFPIFKTLTSRLRLALNLLAESKYKI